MFADSFSVVSIHRVLEYKNAIRYVLPVLCMTSCLPIILGEAKATLLGRIFKVAHWRTESGTKYDVYDCFVVETQLM